jgi:Ran GTPase-activating protein (RanGAP) involved in mRNA processing and transport
MHILGQKMARAMPEWNADPVAKGFCIVSREGVLVALEELEEDEPVGAKISEALFRVSVDKDIASDVALEGVDRHGDERHGQSD